MLCQSDSVDSVLAKPRCTALCIARIKYLKVCLFFAMWIVCLLSFVFLISMSFHSYHSLSISLSLSLSFVLSLYIYIYIYTHALHQDVLTFYRAQTLPLQFCLGRPFYSRPPREVLVHCRDTYIKRYFLLLFSRHIVKRFKDRFNIFISLILHRDLRS